MPDHDRETYHLRVHFGGKGFVADPYWPEVAELINIQKSSGLNRAKSEANRRKALEEHLKLLGKTLADYEALQARAHQSFAYGEDGKIVIPANNIESFLVNTSDVVRAASRPCPPEQVRSLLTVTPWRTEKTAPDGTWERFATVSSGTGAKLSNQRGLRKSEYIADFDAEGEMSFTPDFVKPSVLEQAIRLGGENVGIGASRKMGYGRFTLVEWGKKG